MKKAFTLAEVMITLTVIGIITAIILPVAMHSKPDENVMKFKKGHNTLYQAITTLVNSDKYYLNGDLGVTPDGVRLQHTTAGITPEEKQRIAGYFCESFADVVSAKKVDCSLGGSAGYTSFMDLVQIGTYSKFDENETCLYKQEDGDIEKAKEELDKRCKDRAGSLGHEQIITADGNTFYDITIGLTFGHSCSCQTTAVYKDNRCFSAPNEYPAYYHDENGFDVSYKIFCLDIDGMGEVSFETGKTSNYCDDVKDICPFGYGIRADGKILTGKRADEWLNKSIQGDE